MVLTLNFKNLTDGKIYNLDTDDFIDTVMRGKDVWQSLENDLEILKKFFKEVDDIISDYDSDINYLELPRIREIEEIAKGQLFTWYGDFPYNINELIEKLTKDLEKYKKYM